MLGKKGNGVTFAASLDIEAGMAELVDAYVSGAYARKGVGVRLPLPARNKKGLMCNSVGPFCFLR
jgi:hypothetical protein